MDYDLNTIVGFLFIDEYNSKVKNLTKFKFKNTDQSLMFLYILGWYILDNFTLNIDTE